MGISATQCGITYGAIDEPSRSSKAIDKRVTINFRDKMSLLRVFVTKMMFFDDEML